MFGRFMEQEGGSPITCLAIINLLKYIYLLQSCSLYWPGDSEVAL